jgi:hypothetical protein
VVLHYQQLAGNRAVSDLVAPTLQREGPDGGVPATTPAAAAPTDGGAPAGGVQEDPHVQVRRAFSEHTVDAVAAVTDYTVVSDGERLALLEILLAASPMNALASGAARRIWQAFPDVPLAASDYSAMWERCNVAGASLPESWLGAGAGHASFTLNENVHGSDFVAEVAYGYRITRDAITVKVGYTFTPDAGVTVPEGAWFGFIRSTWNHYTAVNQVDRTQKRRIEFQPGPGADHAVVVHAGEGRANAGEFYQNDAGAPNTIPHEFGHHVGLEDEYERSAADFRRVAEQDPAAPASAVEAPDAPAIATEIRGAIMLEEHRLETHGTAVERRMGALNRVMYRHPELIQTFPTNVGNAKSRAVAAAYQLAYGTELWADIANQIDRNPGESLLNTSVGNFDSWRETMIGGFQFTSTSIMGAPELAVAGTEEHTHPVQPRHVRHFAELVQGFLGHGSWVPEADH